MLRGALELGWLQGGQDGGLGPCRPQGLKWSDGALQHYRQTDPSMSLPCSTSGDPPVIQGKQIPPFGLVQLLKPVQLIGFPNNQQRFKFSQIPNALKKAPNITKTKRDDCAQIEISLNFLAYSVNPLHWFIYFCLFEDGLNMLLPQPCDPAQASQGFSSSSVCWMPECFSHRHQLVQKESPALSREGWLWLLLIHVKIYMNNCGKYFALLSPRYNMIKYILV